MNFYINLKTFYMTFIIIIIISLYNLLYSVRLLCGAVNSKFLNFGIKIKYDPYNTDSPCQKSTIHLSKVLHFLLYLLSILHYYYPNYDFYYPYYNFYYFTQNKLKKPFSLNFNRTQVTVRYKIRKLCELEICTQRDLQFFQI